MSLIKRKNGGLFPALRNDLTELFDMERSLMEPLLETPIWNSTTFARIPAANIVEMDNEYVVELAVPGLEKKDFKVDIDNNILEIKVEKEEESKEKKDRYTRREYNYEAFYRSFNLPDSVKADSIKAEYKNGLLQVHLPKLAEAKKKTVKEIAVS